MNTNKIFIIIFLCVVLGAGIFLIDSRRKKTTDPSATATQQTTEGAPVMTEGVQEQMKQESYTNGISLQITRPQPNTMVNSSTVTVEGKTSPNAEVFVNDAEVKADKTGNFSASITLDEGENPIVVTANDSEGNNAEQQILVTYQP
jgi:hypothetical protein